MLKVKHPNGYTGILYGDNSYVVLDKEGREVLHTGSRNINTEEEVYNNLENFPKLIRLLENINLDEEE